MEEEDKFISITGLICEPSRAKMLWNLLDGRAYTAGELAIVADISGTAASNHLNKLLEAEIVQVERQGRHRYYSFSKPEVAYVIESLASLSTDFKNGTIQSKAPQTGIKYCRSCYDHLAGYVGVQLVEAFETKGYLKKSGFVYEITREGWFWLSQLDIKEDQFRGGRRPLTRQCLDWSERKPHLAGHLGAVLLDKMLLYRWFKRVQFSRELVVTSKGKASFYDLLGIEI